MPEIAAGAAPAATARHYWTRLILAWLLVAALFGGGYAMRAGFSPLHDDADDAMRMVMAIDLLNGQPWQDETVARDNTPYGGQMHWSRLVDAPIAALIAVGGRNFSAIAWPLLLILPTLALSWAATARLVPQARISIVAALFAFNFVSSTEFAPGRVDHHNVQILLVEALLLALLAGRRTLAGGAIAGVVAATCMAIGMETIVIVAAACAALALCWLIDGPGHRRGMIGFGAGLAAGALGHFLIAAAPSHYAVVACDTLSIVYVVAALLGGGAIALGAALGSALAPAWRFALLAGLVAVALAVTFALFPVCLRGPYAQLDIRMLTEQFPTIGEAQPLWKAFEGRPLMSFLYTGPVILGLGIAAWNAARRTGEARQNWLILLLLLVAAAAVMVAQLRGARLTAVLAISCGVWLVDLAITRARPGLLRVLAVAATILAFAPMLQLVLLSITATSQLPGRTNTDEIALEACRMESAYAALAALPAGRVATQTGIASHILLYTPHAVLSAGFHRNGQAMSDTLDFFADEAKAKEISRERGLTYVATCGPVAEIEQRGWLEPIPADGPIRLYRITL